MPSRRDIQATCNGEKPMTVATHRAALGFMVFSAGSQTAWAHPPHSPQPDTLWQFWNLEVWLLTALVVACVLYYLGARRLKTVSRKLTMTRSIWFWCAMLMLFAGLVSPLGPLGSALGSAHMLQHMMLFFSAPLLILSYPIATILWALPRSWAQHINSRSKRALPAWKLISSATFAWTFHAVVMWAWHSPPLYLSALDAKWLHHLMHFSFLVSGILLWWAIFQRIGIGLLLLFTTMLHGGILAALMTFSGQVWYPHYTETTTAWGMTALEDQQLAGMVMWVVGGLGYLLAGLGMIGLWLQRLDGRVASKHPPIPVLPYRRDN